jgi:hypothetical protein
MLREAILGMFGRFRTILGNLGRFRRRFWGNVSASSERATISEPCLVDFGQGWEIWDDFNVDFGQMLVLFRQGDNRFRIV